MPLLKSYSDYTKRMINAFVTQYGATIIAGITDTGLFFPMVVAQISSESRLALQADGTLTASTLALAYNNWGGIKDFSGSGVVMDTTEKQSGKITAKQQPFAKFTDFADFMTGYVNLIKTQNNGKYLPALQAASPEDQIKMIVAAGYSTLSPKEYLKSIQGRIDACRDQYPWGRVNSVAPATVLDQHSSLYNWLFE